MLSEGIDPDRVSWSVVPANSASPVPLAPDLRADFSAHLRRLIETPPPTTRPRSLAQSVAPATPDPPSALDPPGAAESAALARACSACRGWCCRRGGTHAFLDQDSLARVLQADPTLTVRALEALYLAHLGGDHLDGGCIFQGATGCRLPRELRSNTCNTWFCEDLMSWRSAQTAEKRPDDHHFVPSHR